MIAGRYRLEERIGTGEMGEMWRATDTKLRRTVALKRSHDHVRDGQIRREAIIAAGVPYPEQWGTDLLAEHQLNALLAATGLLTLHD